MAKTRNNAKVSAVNNARTRSAKSKAQSGARGGATLEPVKVARRKAMKRQATRSPSPVAGPSNLPARSPSPVAAPYSQPSGVLNAEALSHNAILKEGWYLLQSYFKDIASADEVDAFLNDVKVAELDHAFRDLMGCEPGDDTRQSELGLMITSRIEELERLAVIPKQAGTCYLLPTIKSSIVTSFYIAINKRKLKGKTTFRPNFFGEEDSVSRSLTAQPAAAAASPLPYRHGELMSSSLPPSSPCRNSEQDDQSSPVQDVEARREVLARPPSADGNNEKPTAKPKRRGGLKGKGRQTRIGKGLDAILEDEDVTGASNEGKGKGKNAEGNAEHNNTETSEEGTGKEKSAKAAEDADVADGAEQSEDETSGPPKKRGRLSKEVKSKALAIRQRYDDDLHALAVESGKTVATLLEAVGDIVPEGRSINKWNAFQCYAVHEDGYGMVKNEEQSNTEFKKEIHDLYSLKVEEADGELEQIVDWYKTELAAQTVEKRVEGYATKELEKFSLPFINKVCFIIVIFSWRLTTIQSRQLYQSRQICVMGWSIDPVLGNATVWGADPLFVAMRAANPSQISGQIADYGTMFHTEYMNMKQGRAGLAPEKQAIVNQFPKANKEDLRKLLKDVLIWSLREYLRYFSNAFLTLLFK